MTTEVSFFEGLFRPGDVVLMRGYRYLITAEYKLRQMTQTAGDRRRDRRLCERARKDESVRVKFARL